MLQRNLPAKKCPLQHETAIPSYRRDFLVGDRFVAPDKDIPPFDGSAKEVLIFSRQEFGSKEGWLESFKNFFLEQQVAGAPLWPFQNGAGFVGLSFTEAALNDPTRRFHFEVWLN